MLALQALAVHLIWGELGHLVIQAENWEELGPVVALPQIL